MDLERQSREGGKIYTPLTKGVVKLTLIRYFFGYRALHQREEKRNALDVAGRVCVLRLEELLEGWDRFHYSSMLSVSILLELHH